MTRRHFVTVLCCLALSLFAGAKVPVNENRVILSDGWEFLRSDVGSLWELVRPVPKGKPEEQPVWEKVSLPHSFNAEDAVDPDLNYYQGPGWYRTLLEIDNPYSDGRTVLEFGGAGQKTDVYVNMTKVGSHVGGYDGWNVDITDAVEAFLATPEAKRFKGRVPLSIRCDNGRDAQMIPSSMSDFTVYGGIYRPLSLIYLPEVSVSELKVTPSMDARMKTGTVGISVGFHNPESVKEASVSFRVVSPDGEVVLEGVKGGLFPSGTAELGTWRIAKPLIWDVDNPVLYSCEVTVTAGGESCKAVTRFGFRNFEFKEKGPFHLNGRRLLLRGTHRHEDHAGVGPAMTEDMIRKEMLMIKAMGANFIRLGHYQQSETVLDLCDSLGILVWEEIPWCRGGLGGEMYRDQARDMLTAMISQHYNHPSVIIWGTGNENDWPGDFQEFSEGDIRGFMSELNDMAHRLDPSRKTAIRRCGFCSDVVDVYSPSIWAGWYSGTYYQYQEKSKAEFDKVDHFLHVEWGGDSHAGRHSETVPDTVSVADRNGDWSETYIVKLFDWHLKEQEKMPWLTGTAFWTFKDFATPLRPSNPVPYVNQKGVVQRDLTPKESYYVFQSYWASEPMVHIYGHDRPVRWGGAGEEKEVLVYSNCQEVELFLNGESLGTRRRDSQDFPAAGLHWNVCFKEGKNEICAVSVKDGVADEVSLVYQTAVWGEPYDFAVSAETLGDGILEITVQLVDRDGNCCLDAADFMYFSIAGDGELIRNQGTVHGSGKVQARNGRGQIRVRTCGGASCIAVRYDGVRTKFINI